MYENPWAESFSRPAKKVKGVSTTRVESKENNIKYCKETKPSKVC
jgi:hypothetical protein